MTKSTLRDQEIAGFCIWKHFCLYELQYVGAFYGFHVLRNYSPELFKIGAENFIEILRNRSMNKPKKWCGDSDKKTYEFWLVIAGKPFILGAQNRVQIDGYTILGPVRRPWCAHGPPGSCKRSESFENEQKKLQKEHNFQFLRRLYDHTYEIRII